MKSKKLFGRVYECAPRNSISETTQDYLMFIVEGDTEKELVQEAEKQSSFCRKYDEWYIETFLNDGSGKKFEGEKQCLS
jgi:hypothetical protein